MQAVEDAEAAREELSKKLLAECSDLDRDAAFFAEAFAGGTAPSPLPQEVVHIDGAGLIDWLAEERLGGLGPKPGALVKIRPVSDNEEKKTYLGIYLGELPIRLSFAFNKDLGALRVRLGRRNPAILVPELERIVFGIESWWSEVKHAGELPAITDEMIDNVPYVKAMRKALEDLPEL